jgi:DNA-binding LytR/AlgR family response regulator
MNVAIIEDEKLAAERLAALLTDIDPSIAILAQLPSVEASIAWLREHTPDLLFLDIQLSDGLSFSIFDAVDVRVPVIFTTAYDQYAIKAFKLNSVDYLLKPIRKEDLRGSLQKYRDLKGAYTIDFEELLRTLHGKAAYKQRFLVQYAQKIRKVESGDVAYFFALEKGVFLVTGQKETLPVDYTLDRLEELLDPTKFFRINSKMIVAFKAIRHMIPYSRSRIKIELEPPEPKTVEALVSVERSAAFKEWLDK